MIQSMGSFSRANCYYKQTNRRDSISKAEESRAREESKRMCILHSRVCNTTKRVRYEYNDELKMYRATLDKHTRFKVPRLWDNARKQFILRRRDKRKWSIYKAIYKPVVSLDELHDEPYDEQREEDCGNNSRVYKLSQSIRAHARDTELNVHFSCCIFNL